MPFIRSLFITSIALATCVYGRADNGASFFAPSPTSANPIIRVLLARHFSSATTVYVSADGPFAIKDAAGTIVEDGSTGDRFAVTIAANSLNGGVGVRVAPDTQDYDDTNNPSAKSQDYDDTSGATQKPAPSAALLLVASGYGADTHISIAPSSTAAPIVYRGSIEFAPNNSGKLRVVDVVALEDYVRGVVKAEIGDRAPIAAIEAQAIAARTYTVRNLGRLDAEGADIDDTTRSQGYMGMLGETPPVIDATNETVGQILVYGGAVIDAMYSTECGGMTAVGSSDQPYLRPVADPLCAEKPSWVYKVSKWAVAELVDSTVKGSIKAIDASDLDASGRAATVIITLADESQRNFTGPKFRQLLGYDKLRSTRFTVKTDGDDLIFTGQGWGHGLGMCQAGAIARATGPNGEAYQQILADYYPGTQLTSLTDALVVHPIAPGISPAQVSMTPTPSAMVP